MVHRVEMKLAHPKLGEESAYIRRQQCGKGPSDALDTRCHCNLTQEVEPARDPGCKSSVLGLGYHGSPEIGPAACRMCAANL